MRKKNPFRMKENVIQKGEGGEGKDEGNKMGEKKIRKRKDRIPPNQ